MSAAPAFLLLALQGAAPASELGSVNSEILGYFKLIATLIGVVVLALVVLRFWLPKLSGIGAPSNGMITVVSRLSLEPRKTLYVVRAGSDYMMLGTSEAGVQFLSSLDGEGVEAVMQNAAPEPETGSDFAGLLRFARRFKAPS